MTHYDFDRIIDRRGSGAIKYTALKGIYGREDLIPLWVADMDFATPPFIVDALNERMKHPVFGYTAEPEDYWPAVIDWIRELHGWEVKRAWLSYIPGIVKGIGMAVNVFVKPDEKVIIQPPVYHPFRIVPQSNGREVVYNPLIHNADGSYTMDFDGLAELAADPKCRLLILSNPHNPGGTVWDAESLRMVADICHRNGVIVISDEIHSDMALFGNRHIPFATVSPEAAECSITFGAPSKTFNIAGIVSSWCIIPNERLRTTFFNWLKANEMEAPNLFAPIATIAALRQGREWREQMLRYIEGNIEYVMNFCAAHIPAIKVLRPKASFLVWLDCRGLGLEHDALIDLFVNKAGLALNDGAMFGPGGEGFMRLNVGSPRSVIEQAMRQFADAVVQCHLGRSGEV